MSIISTRPTDFIQEVAKTIATEDHISMNRFIASAVT